MVKKEETHIHVHQHVKRNPCFTEFFERKNPFNESPDKMVVDELSEFDIDFSNGTARRRGKRV